jgi:hypothetical protein
VYVREIAILTLFPINKMPMLDLRGGALSLCRRPSF